MRKGEGVFVCWQEGGREVEQLKKGWGRDERVLVRTERVGVEGLGVCALVCVCLCVGGGQYRKKVEGERSAMMLECWCVCVCSGESGRKG